MAQPAEPNASPGPERIPLRTQRPAALPILAVPIGDRDVVRAAFAWNLVVEIARLGGSGTLLAPEEQEPSPLWPQAGYRPVGAELVLAKIEGLPELNRAALDIAVSRAADTADVVRESGI